MTARSTLRGRRAQAGFSFIEILVVMGIIAVLVGIGLVVYGWAVRKSAEFKTSSLLVKVRGQIAQFESRYGTHPPSNFSKLPNVLGSSAKIGKATPSNTTNLGVESVYQAFVAPGVRINPDLDKDKANTDHDALDAAFDSHGDANLYEIKDDQGNPLVYIVESDYTAFEKAPPTYSDRNGNAFHPKPWRNSEGTAFAQSNGYQLFSIGRDGIPNTEDDVKAWE